MVVDYLGHVPLPNLLVRWVASSLGVSRNLENGTQLQRGLPYFFTSRKNIVKEGGGVSSLFCR